MIATRSRRDQLDEQITVMAADEAYAPMVCRLGCLRGVSTLTAFALAVEVGDWQRLTGRTIGAFLTRPAPRAAAFLPDRGRGDHHPVRRPLDLLNMHPFELRKQDIQRPKITPRT